MFKNNKYQKQQVCLNVKHMYVNNMLRCKSKPTVLQGSSAGNVQIRTQGHLTNSTHFGGLGKEI